LDVSPQKFQPGSFAKQKSIARLKLFKKFNIKNMFVIPTNVGLTHRVVAMLVACAVVLWSIGAYTTAQAANLTFISNTLTDSGPSVTSGHAIQFTMAPTTTLAVGNTVSITFPAGFTGVSTIISSDLTVTANAAPVTIGAFTAVGQVVTFNGVAATAGQVVRIVIANGKVTNPATIQSHEFLVALSNATNDTGRTRVAIVNYVTVSAVVNTIFDFVVAGLATSSAVNGTTTSRASTATTIPFGVIVGNGIYTLAQQLTVATNARNGFVVTVQQDRNLQSSTGADIDGFLNGAYTNTPTAWAAPSNSLLLENTWGHWGLTSNDSTLNANEFNAGTGGDRWVAASTTPRAIFSHGGPSDGTTQDAGLARVGYQVQISPLQEAGDDYTTTLMYIATPTF